MLETWQLLILKIFLLNLFGNKIRNSVCETLKKTKFFLRRCDIQLVFVSLSIFGRNNHLLIANQRPKLQIVLNFFNFCISELDTQDKLEYTWFPASGAGVVFRVRAANDAHVALSSIEGETTPMLEVFIGGWGNAKSVIRKNRSKPEVAEEATPGILSAGEFRGFWIRWTGNHITVGREGEAAAFLSYENNEAFHVNHVGICTGW